MKISLSGMSNRDRDNLTQSHIFKRREVWVVILHDLLLFNLHLQSFSLEKCEKILKVHAKAEGQKRLSLSSQTQAEALHRILSFK